MYNLLVSGSSESWHGDPWQIELARCVRENEYTEAKIAKRFGALDTASVAELKRLPCIFAYEAYNQLAPKFGIIRDITKRRDQVRIEYEIQPIDPFLTAEDLEALTFELDIRNWELNRTHWAVKDVNLPEELRSKGITFPPWARAITQAVDISSHQFDVALSFPGEARPLVEQVARELERAIGPNSYFYDNNYLSQLARPSLDTLLQDIYRNRSKLIVAFLSSNYQNKDWCGVEFRAIKEIIFERNHARIMFVRTDEGSVEGIFKTDGYIDARKFRPADIAQFIVERLHVLSGVKEVPPPVIDEKYKAAAGIEEASPMSDPEEAYKAAAAARAKRLQEENDAKKRAQEFPGLAEQKLLELDAAIKAKVPAGLSLETTPGPGGLLGERGIKSLFLKLKEDGRVVAQGAISVGNDEKIVLQGFPPDKDKRPEKEFGETPFASFTPEMAVAFMSNLIATYLK